MSEVELVIVNDTDVTITSKTIETDKTFKL